MQKELQRDAATDAFRFWAYVEMLTKRSDVVAAYQALLTADILREENLGIHVGFSSPTEAQLIAADRRLDKAQAAIADLQAVARTLAWMMSQEDGAELIEAVRAVYMADPLRPWDRDTLRDRTVQYSLKGAYIDLSTAYRRLKKARIKWAEERGLRIFEFK